MNFSLQEMALPMKNLVSRSLTASIAIMAALPTMASGQSGGSGAQNGAAVSGVGKTSVIDCQGGPAQVSGTENHISFTGACSGLTVSGVDNQINILLRSGAAIHVSGTDNVVTWRMEGKGRPAISISGVDNRVAAAR